MNELALAVILPMCVFACLDIVVLYNTYRNRLARASQKMFFIFACLVTTLQITSILGYAVDYGLFHINIIVIYILTILTITSMTMASFYWFLYLFYALNDGNRMSKLRELLCALPIFLMLAASISSPWTHLVFFIDENGMYHGGTLQMLQVTCPYFYTVAAVIVALVQVTRGNAKYFSKMMRNFMVFVIPSVIGALIQLKVFRGGYTQIGISFCLMFMYMEQYLEEMNEYKRLKSIEEINRELKENQTRLETATVEQEEQIKEITDLNEALRQRMKIIQSMSKVYFTSFYVDLIDGKFMEISNTDYVRKYIGDNEDLQEGLMLFCEQMVRPESREEIVKFVDLSTINERMKDKKVITCDYIGNVAGWCQLYIIEGERDFEGKLTSVFIAARTIHDEKAREAEQNRMLDEARKQAEAANESKTIFLNNMSHDIRTPMNAILGFAELLEREKNHPERVTDYLKKMRSSGNYLLTIINNVLDMARIESGNAVVEEGFMDLAAAEENIINMFEDMLQKKDLKFTANRDITHRYVLLDKTKMQQITMNLISNAVKYTPDGGNVYMTIKELPSEREGYATYVMKVTDTGIGMSPEFQKHVFDSFTREKNTTESKIIGTGLGMAIVKKLVELQGGTIEVSSEFGRGTTFTVTLEHKIVEDPTPYLSEQVEKNSATVLEGKRILLAEDNALNAEIAMAILQDAGMQVEHAEDGVDCVKMLMESEAGYYDLILMDIQMPNMNGYDATHQIRELDDEVKSHIPIIAMTANAFDEDRQNALAAGMNGHLAKPIKIPKLLEAMEEILAK